MSKVGTFVALCMLATSVALAQAPDAVQAKIIEEGKNHSHVMHHLDHLVNEIGPRLTGSQRLIKACEWAVATFKSFGIENAHVEQWGECAVGFDRTTLEGRMVAPEKMKFELTTSSWTVGTNGMTRGTAILGPQTKEELAALGDSLKGKWILEKGTSRRRAAGEPTPEPAADAQGTPLSRDEKQAAYEAAGVLGIVRSSGSNLVLTSGNWQTQWEKWPKLPSITIRRDDFDACTNAIAQKKEVVLEFDIGNKLTKGPIPLYNVFAEIPGTEKPDEYVFVGGHIDSWDGAAGTTDNGTGVATTIEAARLLMLAGAKPKRTIRFTLWSGEEQGLLGSQAWIKAHPEMLPKISAILIHDGGTAVLTGIHCLAGMRDDFEKATALLPTLDQTFPFKVETIPSFFPIGSDHDSFNMAGVPGFFWRQDSSVDYNHTHHTQYDTYDAARPDHQRQSSMVVALTALGVANLDHLIDRKDMKSGAAAGGPRRPRFGVMLDEKGVVTDLVEDSLAAKAGVKVGDRLLTVGDVEIKSTMDIRRAMQGDGDKKKVVLERAGQKVELSVSTAPASAPAKPDEKKN